MHPGCMRASKALVSEWAPISKALVFFTRGAMVSCLTWHCIGQSEEGDMHSQANEAFCELEGRVYMALRRICDYDKLALLLLLHHDYLIFDMGCDL
nr:hypothetical protein CFP56_28433 [Quercus suber]